MDNASSYASSYCYCLTKQENVIHSELNIRGTCYEIKHKNALIGKRIHTVFIPDDLLYPPICNCRRFKCFRIPHSAIACAMCIHHKRDFYAKESLCEYWHIDRHPCYIFAMNDLLQCQKLPLIGVVNTSGVIVNASPNSFHGKLYDSSIMNLSSIEIPKSPKQKYTVLHGLFQNIVKNCDNSDTNYRLALLQMKGIYNNLSNPSTSPNVMVKDCMGSVISNSESTVMSLPLPPNVSNNLSKQIISIAEKKANTTICNSENKLNSNNVISNYNKKKKEHGRKCQTCIGHGIVPTDNHRASSSYCQFSPTHGTSRRKRRVVKVKENDKQFCSLSQQSSCNDVTVKDNVKPDVNKPQLKKVTASNFIIDIMKGVTPIKKQNQNNNIVMVSITNDRSVHNVVNVDNHGIDDIVVYDSTVKNVIPNMSCTFDLVNVVNTFVEMGKIVEMLPDGNCGYHACKHGLVRNGKLSSTTSITVFRECIKDYITSNGLKLFRTNSVNWIIHGQSGEMCAPFRPTTVKAGIHADQSNDIYSIIDKEKTLIKKYIYCRYEL